MTSAQATLNAALVAAGLSAATLAVTVLIETARLITGRKDERTKWIRGTLHEVALKFIEAGFTISGLSGEARRIRLQGADIVATQELLELVRDAHADMQAALTSLRLLSPSEVVKCAEQLHDSHHRLINTAFGHRPPIDGDEEAWRSLKDCAREDRRGFLRLVRKPLGLDANTPAIEAGDRSYWTVPADQETLDVGELMRHRRALASRPTRTSQ